MPKQEPQGPSQPELNENWYWYLTGNNKEGFSADYEKFVKRLRRTMAWVPGAPRCFECNRPMTGFGAWLMQVRPSTFSPKLCNMCEDFSRRNQAGAEVELSMLFADVRGSTTLAEQTSPAEFQKLIRRFYKTATDVLVEKNSMVNRLMGDQVIGLFVPRFAGHDHAKVAIKAALELLRATGHGTPEGAWVPIGIGVHTGVAYVGAVGTSEGVNEIAVLGSAPNLAARLSSQAADGELLVSEAAAAAASITDGETRELQLKGISQPVSVHVLRAETQPSVAGVL
jgi:adenylate cyclase